MYLLLSVVLYFAVCGGVGVVGIVDGGGIGLSFVLVYFKRLSFVLVYFSRLSFVFVYFSRLSFVFVYFNVVFQLRVLHILVDVFIAVLLNGRNAFGKLMV